MQLPYLPVYKYMSAIWRSAIHSWVGIAPRIGLYLGTDLSWGEEEEEYYFTSSHVRLIRCDIWYLGTAKTAHICTQQA
jgi:hypothetical protein